jgi:hypothetical protein
MQRKIKSRIFLLLMGRRDVEPTPPPENPFLLTDDSEILTTNTGNRITYED